MTWDFKPDAEAVASDDFWYDLTNGYIDPATLLSEADAIKLKEAVSQVESFFEDLSAAGLLEEM